MIWPCRQRYKVSAVAPTTVRNFLENLLQCRPLELLPSLYYESESLPVLHLQEVRPHYHLSQQGKKGSFYSTPWFHSPLGRLQIEISNGSAIEVRWIIAKVNLNIDTEVKVGIDKCCKVYDTPRPMTGLLLPCQFALSCWQVRVDILHSEAKWSVDSTWIQTKPALALPSLGQLLYLPDLPHMVIWGITKTLVLVGNLFEKYHMQSVFFVFAIKW